MGYRSIAGGGIIPFVDVVAISETAVKQGVWFAHSESTERINAGTVVVSAAGTAAIIGFDSEHRLAQIVVLHGFVQVQQVGFLWMFIAGTVGSVG